MRTNGTVRQDRCDDATARVLAWSQLHVKEVGHASVQQASAVGYHGSWVAGDRGVVATTGGQRPRGDPDGRDDWGRHLPAGNVGHSNRFTESRGSVRGPRRTRP